MRPGNQKRSLSVSSSDALYHAIPQAPVAANPAPRCLSISDTDVELSEAEDEDVLDEPVVAGYLDPRIRWVHFILGSAVLLPWNALITATPYFISRLSGTSLASTFSSYLSITFTISNFGFLAHATATSKQASPARRVLSAMMALAVLTLLLTLSTYTHGPPGLFFAFVIVNGIAQAGAGSYLQTSVIAVASLFGPGAMQSLFSGQAAVGVAVSLVQVLSAAASVHDSDSPSSTIAPRDPITDGKAEEKSAFVFFGLSFLFLLVSAAVYVWMTRLPAYNAVVMSEDGPGKVVTPPADDDQTAETHGLVSSARRRPDARANIIRVAKANLIYELSVAYIFVVTLAVFPPITISIHPTNPATHPLLFSALHFLLYNIGDFIGRYLCSIPSLLIWSARRLAAMSFARTIFIPLFLMCNLQQGDSSSVTSSSTPVINSDIAFFVLLLLFGLSNGYVCSMTMMSAASLEHNRRLKGRKQDIDIAATVASFSLVTGLVLGSAASFAVRSAVCGGCNPFKG
ncbi:hypothetical protein NEOLEDRAFT_1061600 [Neolentinus lepideus HHB14362 ss-1]|uniref:Nucleoside transporter n=1 Tax=Neolentinus lepideus HHB14362 ss-1 TaxID=1314782 RepID=A0A165TPX1_9AGAM|nr:hypothetical protein NEOLEDRAFT_1061600 [Neolentinus lepideus HHB14362 ss-1]